MQDFDVIWQKYSKDSRIEFACFSFHVGLLVITLSSLKLYTENNACMLQSAVELSALFLVALETQNFVNNPRNWWSIDPPVSREISRGSEVLPDSATPTQLCRGFISSHPSAAARTGTPIDWSELHQQPVDTAYQLLFRNSAMRCNLYIHTDFWLKFSLLC